MSDKYWKPAFDLGDEERFKKLMEKVNKLRKKEAKPAFNMIEFQAALIRVGTINREALVEI